MTITYQVEKFEDMFEEAFPLFEKHWKVSALFHSKIALNPNIELYAVLNSRNLLHVVTVRDDGKLIGYAINVLAPESLHYKQVSQATSDIYYIDPCDNPLTLVARYKILFKFVEEELIKAGIKQHFVTTKVHSDIGAIWEKCGYREIERKFTKLIGDW